MLINAIATPASYIKGTANGEGIVIVLQCPQCPIHQSSKRTGLHTLIRCDGCLRLSVMAGAEMKTNRRGAAGAADTVATTGAALLDNTETSAKVTTKYGC